MLPGRTLASSTLMVSLLVSGCEVRSPDDSSADASDTAVNTASPPASRAQSAPSTNPVSAPLSTADIERWERGIAAERKAVEEAGAKLKAARNGEDTLNVIMGVQEMATLGAGAQAAGLEQERYKFVRSNLSAAVGYLTPFMEGMDTTIFSKEQRDEMRQGNERELKRMEQDVPSDVIEMLRPRAAELRKKNLELVGARLKAAGMV